MATKEALTLRARTLICDDGVNMRGKTNDNKLIVATGDQARNFQTGNFLNAIDEVVAFFSNSRCMGGPSDCGGTSAVC